MTGLNLGPLESEATDLPTEPQSLPNILLSLLSMGTTIDEQNISLLPLT